MTKIAVDAQKQSPLPFRAFLRPFLHVFHDQLRGLYSGPGDGPSYPASPATSPPGFERLAVNAITFLANVLACEEYRPELAAQHLTSASSRAPSATGDQEVEPPRPLPLPVSLFLALPLPSSFSLSPSLSRAPANLIQARSQARISNPPLFLKYHIFVSIFSISF